MFFGLQLTRGMLLSKSERVASGISGVLSEFAFATNEPSERLEATIAVNTTARASRSTKKVDNPPVRFKSLPSFRCRRYCFLSGTILMACCD